MNLISQRLAAISQPPVLWALFAATVVITLLFPLLAGIWQLTLVDPISAPDAVRAVIGSMSQEQKTAHAWITATLDVAYPLAYGLLFAGVALHFFERYGAYLALAGLLAIPVDLFEGVVQVLALTDAADLVDLKALLTPLKSGLFIAGLLFCLVAWARWLVRKVRARGDH